MASHMSVSGKIDLLIPGGLLALSLVPVLAGAFRIGQLVGGAEVTHDNARFLASPVPVGLHIVGSVIYSLMGAFQFSPGFRRRYPQWHRAAGRMLIPCSLIVALSGIWMAQHFPLGKLQGPLVADFDGRSLYIIRMLVGSAMTLFIGLCIAALLKRAF